jgi:DnaJ-class molecular chaperone
MKYNKCPKCSGKGWIVNKGYAFLTFGISLLFQCVDNHSTACEDDYCDLCDGNGYIKE